ncbi:MAG TPA: YihY/virulence factor BrkB family protein [Candidatus Binatia bacterium]|nr:YihY/virulence factor BrkB family protein [Candidatus Binatia bacterium]
MVDRLKRLMRDLDAWSGSHRFARVARRAVAGFIEHEAPSNAGSMAYFAMLSMFQLLVLGVVALSYIVGEGDARRFVVDQVQAGSPIDAETVGAVIDAVIDSRGGISLFGVVFLVWGALGIFSAMSKGISRAFAVGKPRPFLQDQLLGLTLMAITGLLGVASIAIGIVTGIIQTAAGDAASAVPGGELALGAIGFVLPLVLIFAAFVVLYRIVPNRPVTIREVWPGALVAAVLWTVLRIGFTWYATSIARYDTAFGPISAGVSLLVFLYFASLVVLFGAEVARANVLESEAAKEVVAAPSDDPVEPPSDPLHARVAEGRPLPGWALAIGGAVAGALVRRLSRRGRGGDES